MSKKSESVNNKTETKTEKEVIEKEIDESTSPETKIEVEVEVEEHPDPAFEVGYNGEPLSKALGRNNRLEKETLSRSWSRGMIERKLDYLSEWADRRDIDSVALMGLVNKLKALCREYGDES